MIWIKNFILIFISSLICFFILVFGDYLLNKFQNAQKYNALLEYEKMEKERIETEDAPMREEAKKNKYFPALYPDLINNLNINNPLIAGLADVKTYYCNEGYGLIKYQSDRFGFRNQDNIWDSKITNIVIGDSFVQGACVSNEDTITAHLSKLTKSSTLNLGIGGNNPSHYLTYSSLFIPKLFPEKVFLVFYTNDFGDHPKSLIEKTYIDGNKDFFNYSTISSFDTIEYKQRGLKILSMLKKQEPKIQYKKNFITRLSQAFVRHISLPTARKLIFKDSKKLFNSTKRSIEITYNLCEIYNCKLTIVFIPNSDILPDYRSKHYAELIENFTNLLNINFINGTQILNTTNGSLDYAIKGHHLSPIGYKKLTELMYKN